MLFTSNYESDQFSSKIMADTTDKKLSVDFAKKYPLHILLQKITGKPSIGCR